MATQVISYDPTMRFILYFVAVAALCAAMALFGFYPPWLAYSAAGCFLAFTLLLLLRRLLWRRHLILTEEAITIPLGFLCLYPQMMRYDQFQRIWLSRFLIIPIIRIKGNGRTLPILGVYLRDEDALELMNALDSVAMSLGWVRDANAV